MNNALYDKTMENLRNRINVKFVSKKKKAIYNRHQNQTICHKKYLTIIWLQIVKTKLH